MMGIRRVVLDVDKARERPSLIEIVESIEKQPGVEAINITVDDVDIDTMGTVVVIEGENLNYEKILLAIESTGAVVHNVDQIVSGDWMIEYIPPVRS